MNKDTFTLLGKSYVGKYAENKFSSEELIGLLRLMEGGLKKIPMFRFGEGSTILYTINELEKDLLYSTKEAKQFLEEQIKDAYNVGEIIVEF